MLRISLHVSPNTETLDLEGELQGEWVTELRRVATAVQQRCPSPRLDLAEVRFASPEGAALIRRLCAGGFVVVRSSSFMDTLLRLTPP